MAAQEGHTAVARCLVKELDADVEKASEADCTPLCIAVQEEHLEVTCCLVKELGADVDRADEHGFTPLLIATQEGHLHFARSLIEVLGADVNKATHDGRTPLMMASYGGHAKIVHLLTKRGADSQVSAPDFGTAADISQTVGAPVELTEYLEAKTHCSKPGCGGAGIKKCTGCKQVRYCGQACQLAHWSAHKAACKAHQAKVCKGK
jgi:ankyrin repeat protein